MMLTVPTDLTSERQIETPVGTWSMDGNITIFDAKSKTEIDRVTSPKVGGLRRLIELTKAL